MSCCWKWGSQLSMLDRLYTLPQPTHSTKSELSFSMIGIWNSVSKQGSIQGTIHSCRPSVNPSIPPLSQATYKMPQLVYSKAWKNALSDSSLGKPSKIDQSWWFTAPIGTGGNRSGACQWYHCLAVSTTRKTGIFPNKTVFRKHPKWCVGSVQGEFYCQG